MPRIEHDANYQSQRDEQIEGIILELDPPRPPTTTSNIEKDEKNGPRAEPNP